MRRIVDVGRFDCRVRSSVASLEVGERVLCVRLDSSYVPGVEACAGRQQYEQCEEEVFGSF